MKTILPLLILLIAFGCQKENSIEAVVSQPGSTITKNLRAGKSGKTTLCHNGHLIQVGSNSLKAHLAHGDVVQFGQLGTYIITYTINGSNYVHEGLITESENGVFSGTGQSITTGQQWTVNGTIDEAGNYSFTLHYTASSYTATATGTFGCDGSGYSGNWSDSSNQSGTWSATFE